MELVTQLLSCHTDFNVYWTWLWYYCWYCRDV